MKTRLYLFTLLLLTVASAWADGAESDDVRTS